MRRFSWLIAPALAVASGCSLLVDSSGLTGGGATGPDAALDGASIEGGDAASDATAAADARADGSLGQRFCAVQGPLHSFCADFDDPGSVSATAWNGSTTTPEITSGEIVIDPSAWTSPPASLSTSIDAQDGGVTFHANLSRSFSAPAPNMIRCEFDFRFDRGAMTGSIGVFDLTFDSFGVELGIAPDGTAKLYEYTSMVANSAGTIMNGKWVHVTIALQRSAPSASVSLDGVTVLQYAPLNMPASPAAATFLIGIEGETGGQPGCQFHYDNVICDAK